MAKTPPHPLLTLISLIFTERLRGSERRFALQVCDRDKPERGDSMLENQSFRPASVIGPLGEVLTLDSLPPPGTTRWVVRRKAEVVSAVKGGILTVDEACDRYGLTLEEFASWQHAVDRSGMPGLRVTRVQHYRALYDRLG